MFLRIKKQNASLAPFGGPAAAGRGVGFAVGLAFGGALGRQKDFGGAVGRGVGGIGLIALKAAGNNIAAGVNMRVAPEHRSSNTNKFSPQTLGRTQTNNRRTSSRTQVPGSSYQVPGTWYQVSGTWYLVPSTRYHVPGTR